MSVCNRDREKGRKRERKRAVKTKITVNLSGRKLPSYYLEVPCVCVQRERERDQMSDDPHPPTN